MIGWTLARGLRLDASSVQAGPVARVADSSEARVKTLPTRTLNPLPFNDLEPHRFEDLVRQLAYEFRRWKSLEATGRAGSDSGIDIRATELVPVDDELAEEEEDKSAEETAFQERVWIFQCKRDKVLPPKRLRKVVEESLMSLAAPPHGFILAVACDVSKGARDAFREEMVARGVEEFLIWAKSELEDLLFQPKNDRLLFAYFGISLQPRRRSLSTTLRSDIAKKKQLSGLIGDENRRDGKLVLLRDPTDERYPEKLKTTEPPQRWLLCRAIHLRQPGQLAVLAHEFLAAITADRQQWDAIFDYDVMMNRAEGELSSGQAWGIDDVRNGDRSAHDFWNEYIDEANRAHLKILRWVPFDRILAVDPLGDGYFPVPHILVEFANTTGPFTAHVGRWLQGISNHLGHFDIDLGEKTRALIFPKPLPKGTDPEPKHFDDTGKENVPLTIASSDKLKALLARAMERKGRLNLEEAPEAAASRDQQAHAQRLEFLQWRDEIAQPVFSSFVYQLRANGHRARVQIRSSQSSQDSDSIELKVCLDIWPHYNRSGHIRISQFKHSLRGWQMDVSPSPDRGSGQSGLLPTTNMTPNAQTTREQLEAMALEMLERLQIQFP